QRRNPGRDQQPGSWNHVHAPISPRKLGTAHIGVVNVTSDQLKQPGKRLKASASKAAARATARRIMSTTFVDAGETVSRQCL
ncbi:MAG TPA: hypothetical protein PK866_03445, partial [Nitrospira sp.]|nr:hypothetical protein [Nitrospira sp.]